MTTNADRIMTAIAAVDALPAGYWPETNRTEDDARQRITLAKLGAHVEATDTYLVQLRAQLFGWIAQIDAEMALRLKRANDRREHEAWEASRR